MKLFPKKIILTVTAIITVLFLFFIGYRSLHLLKRNISNIPNNQNREIFLYKIDNYLEIFTKKHHTNPLDLYHIIREWQLFNDKDDIQIINILSSNSSLIIHSSGFFKNCASALEEYKLYISLYKTFKKLGYEKIYLFHKDDLEKPAYLNTNIYFNIDYLLNLNKQEIKPFFLREIERYSFFLHPYFGQKKYGNSLLDRYEKSLFDEIETLYQNKNDYIHILEQKPNTLKTKNPCTIFCSFSIGDQPYIGLYTTATEKKLVKPFMDIEKINGIYKAESSYIQHFFSYFLTEKGHHCISLEIESDLFNKSQHPTLHIHVHQQTYQELKNAFKDIFHILASTNKI